MRSRVERQNSEVCEISQHIARISLNQADARVMVIPGRVNLPLQAPGACQVRLCRLPCPAAQVVGQSRALQDVILDDHGYGFLICDQSTNIPIESQPVGRTTNE